MCGLSRLEMCDIAILSKAQCVQAVVLIASVICTSSYMYEYRIALNIVSVVVYVLIICLCWYWCINKIFGDKTAIPVNARGQQNDYLQHKDRSSQLSDVFVLYLATCVVLLLVFEFVCQSESLSIYYLHVQSATWIKQLYL